MKISSNNQGLYFFWQDKMGGHCGMNTALDSSLPLIEGRAPGHVSGRSELEGII